MLEDLEDAKKIYPLDEVVGARKKLFKQGVAIINTNGKPTFFANRLTGTEPPEEMDPLRLAASTLATIRYDTLSFPDGSSEKENKELVNKFQNFAKVVAALGPIPSQEDLKKVQYARKLLGDENQLADLCGKLKEAGFSNPGGLSNVYFVEEVDALVQEYGKKYLLR